MSLILSIDCLMLDVSLIHADVARSGMVIRLIHIIFLSDI